MDEFKLVVASNLIKLRRQAGLTQAELGQRLNYSDKTVSKWERGESLPDAYVLSRLAEIYGLTVDSLLHKESWQPPVDQSEVPSYSFSSRVVTAVAVLGLWTMALLMFIIFWLSMNLILWQMFVLAVPVSVIVLLVLNSVWNHGRHNMIIVMALVLSIVVSVFLMLPGLPWIILPLIIPAEVLVYLGFHVNMQAFSRTMKKLTGNGGNKPANS